MVSKVSMENSLDGYTENPFQRVYKNVWPYQLMGQNMASGDSVGCRGLAWFARLISTESQELIPMANRGRCMQFAHLPLTTLESQIIISWLIKVIFVLRLMEFPCTSSCGPNKT